LPTLWIRPTFAVQPFYPVRFYVGFVAIRGKHGIPVAKFPAQATGPVATFDGIFF
jgi:hypothetical protein